MSSPSGNRPWLRVGAGVLALGWLLSCQVDKLFQDGGSDPPAARLEFAAPPNATAGEPLSPAVRVSAVDSTGIVDTTFHGAVTVTLGDNPGRGTLRGTRTIDAVRGVASFADLSIDRTGTGYTLVATATGVRGATSPAFDVAPAAAARLTFTAQPHTTTVDSVLKPPVQVTAFDTLGNVATSFVGNVTVALAANASGGALGGTTTLAAASGVATFADLKVNRVGAGYRLTASAGQLAGATSDSFDITAGPPTTGDLTVNATTTGDDAPGSYTVKVDGGLSRTIAANGAGTTYNALPAGDHTVALTDVPANCTVSGGASQTVTVPAGGSATAAFTISCTALTGNLTVRTTTTGANLDPDGYTFSVDGGTPQPIGINATIPLTGIPAGSRTVVLAGVAANCTVTGGPSQTVTVPPSGTATAAFAVSCAALTGDLAVTTSTSGASQPSGYSVTVDGGSSKSIGASDSITYSGIAAANHSVRLNDVPANCSVNGLNPRMVTVPPGGAVEASFTITCSALTGTLNVTTSTSGDSPDPNGYTFTVDNGTPQSIANSQTIALTLPTGSHTVRLGDVAANCTVANGTSQTVTVTTSGAVSASFTITCTALTGSLTVSTSTTGSSQPSGYTVTVDGGSSKSVGVNDNVTYTGLTAANHTVQLNGVPANCSVAEANPQTVTVTAGGTAQASFTITCTAPNQPPTAAFPAPSCSGLTCSFTDQSSDPDGTIATRDWDFGDGSTHATQANPTHTYGAGGTYTVRLTVTDNQGASDAVTHSVTVLAPPPPTGSLTVSTSTSGGTPDPDGYTVTVSGAGSQPIGTNDNVTFSDLATGSHTVTLSGIASNCSVSGGTSRTVTVTADQTATASFSISCPTPPPPNQPPSVTAGGDQNVLIGALFSLSDASFTDPDHNGPWTVTINWGDGNSSRFSASEGPINASHTYITILPASYTLTITVTDPGGLSGSDSKTVKVTTL
ncbi:MAG TPA: PKD domain-containing protein [Gemmatimonadales bacterium]